VKQILVEEPITRRQVGQSQAAPADRPQAYERQSADILARIERLERELAC
jgi:hypothetical protein